VTIVSTPQTLECICPHCNKKIQAIRFRKLNFIRAYLTDDAQFGTNIYFLGCPECKIVFFEVDK